MLSNDMLAAGEHAIKFIYLTNLHSTARTAAHLWRHDDFVPDCKVDATHHPRFLDLLKVHSCASGIRSSNGGLPSSANRHSAHRTTQFPSNAAFE